jgi:hypothetical protein
MVFPEPPRKAPMITLGRSIVSRSTSVDFKNGYRRFEYQKIY